MRTLVDVDGPGEILGPSNLRLDQMVAVDGGGGLDAVHAGRHELQNGHLGGGILAGHAVGAQLEIRDAALDVLAVGVVEVRVQDLLAEGEGAVEAAAHDGEVLRHLLVVDEVVLLAGEQVLPDLRAVQKRKVSNTSQRRGLRRERGPDSERC